MLSKRSTDRLTRKKAHLLRRNHLLLLFIQVATFLLIIPLSNPSWDGVIISQEDYEGLQAFKHSIDDLRGFLRSWNGTGLGACSGAWVGIKCVRGKVIAIQLPWRDFEGHITEKIGQLNALRKLSLHDNAISGQIPSALGFLRELRGVYLFNNRLSGTIPPSIGSCIALQTIDISNNLLSGIIPSSLSNASRLYRLNLSFNNLTGSIPDGVASLPSLTYLTLQNNNLSGNIPETWGTYQLKTLNLDHNSISGNIPKSLGGLALLRDAILSNNRLNGSFPLSMCNLSSLVQLNLENNQIGNRLPAAIDGLKNLSLLSLKMNRFDGEIPETLGNISSLSQLDLSDNNLTGRIPSSLEHLVNLTFFNVSYNNLSGQVPLFLSRKFNSSSFLGNIQLCGYSNSVPCTPPPSPSFPPPSVPPKHNHTKLNTLDIILIVVGITLVLLVVLCFILLCCLIRKRSASTSKPGTAGPSSERGEKPGPGAATETESGGDIGGKLVHFDGPLVFTADDLLCATAEIMGKSTYGTMYKATLEDGSHVAVKRLRERIAKNQKEFETDVNVLGKIRHSNLLALRAYYVGPKGEKLLVFDFMSKRNLSSFLHARGPETTIDWPIRMRIAMGVARGLWHLHSKENIVHGNLTGGNILLDDNTTAKIADFGLSRLMTAAANSNVIAAAGALGYRAPELSKLKKASTKTDVYSLGVVILELLTGKSPGEPINCMELPQWVASVVKEEWTNEVFDVEIMKDAAAGDELLNTLKLALLCVDPSPAARPEVQEIMPELRETDEGGFGGDEGGGASTSGGK
ncbi:probably inactive leucine-rich repeat receptor-like protein kinase IMK2 [Phalaenopsis equestris]|uniref:probably inactive leucine-rich repeat receptor-like protein kinase IMK2 n=1 Tax=Phalaenopsis equestris TaxID=78828 RepID=UPI0009E2EF96|nr:probably inactive leucine-rich repeat receptor-like protein kinase IMK2 [Phalaenopsis equestris]